MFAGFLTDRVFVASASRSNPCTGQQMKNKYRENCIATTHKVVSRHKCINKSHSSTWSCHLETGAVTAVAATSIFNDLFAVWLHKDTKHTWTRLRFVVCVCWPKRIIPYKTVIILFDSLECYWTVQVGSFLTCFPHAHTKRWIEFDTCFISCRSLFNFVVIFMAFPH